MARKLKAKVKQFVNKWYTSGKGPKGGAKVYLNAEEIHSIVTDQLEERLFSFFTYASSDDEYYATPLSHAKAIIKLSGLDRSTYVDELFDCDDFAHILKAHFIQAAYKLGLRRKPHAFGVAWGFLDDEHHAWNWMVNSDRKLRFIEPQTNEVFLPEEHEELLYFMYL